MNDPILAWLVAGCLGLIALAQWLDLRTANRLIAIQKQLIAAWEQECGAYQAMTDKQSALIYELSHSIETRQMTVIKRLPKDRAEAIDPIRMN